MKRYVVGIDLGTTNTVVAYADSANSLNLTSASGQPGNDEIHLLQIEQLVAAGQIGAAPLLPSVRYHGAPGELAPLELTLPWPQPEVIDSTDSAQSDEKVDGAEQGPVVFGQFARALGAQVPGRLVVSAKSWLSHAGVDRLAPILPWGSPSDSSDGAKEGVAKVSPVAASASYLAYVRCCWNRQFPDHPLEQQDVVLTVPASFDEGARLLTIEAARDAGLPQLRLLEEPQAVLHDWLFRHRENLARDLAGTQLVLVCDVGGGTTDLSLIRVQIQGSSPAGEPAGEPLLTRIGVGDHLMLGGDNMDLALAHLVETRFAEAALASGQAQAGAGPRLSTGAWSQLMERCRAVKESLLSADAPEHAAVTLLGAGSRLIARAKSVEVLQAEVQALIVDGFFPMVGKHDVVQRGRSGIVEFGLPYARDPAITRHIASFLQQQGALSAALPALDNAAQEGLPSGLPDIAVSDMPLLDALLPDTLLLNGGVFRAAALARRLGDTLAAWRGAPLRMLDNDDTEVAVARGAVAYALAGQGRAPAIAGGAARSYFLVLDDPAAGAPVSAEAKAEAKAGAKAEAKAGRAICVLARGSEIGTEIMLQERTFGLRVGQPVRFHLMSSSAGGHAKVGDIIDLDDASLVRLPPIAMVLPADPGAEGGVGAGVSAAARDARRQIRVHLASTLTELGTLQMHCVEALARDGAGSADTADGAGAAPSARRWLLQFQLRAQASEMASDSACGAAVGDDDPSARAAIPGLKDAIDKIERIFGSRTQQVDAKDVRQLRSQLEQLLGSRERWSTPLLRQLFDALMARAGKRRRSSEHERAWFNLAGYCLRPGYGAPLDEWRIEQLWALFEAGVQHGNDSAVCAQWWTLWRRVTGGLDGPAQLRLLADFACNVQGGGDASATLVNASFDDMLSLCGALERIPSAYKVEIGTWLLGQLPGADDSFDRPSDKQVAKQVDKQVAKQVGKQSSKHAGKQERKHGVKVQADDQSKLDARAARLLWALGRIGARQPFHGNADDVVPPAVAAQWITTLLALDWKRIDAAAFACAHIARMSGDRARDVETELRERLALRLKATSAPPGWVLMLQEVVQLGVDDERRMLGEALPPGLILLS